MTLGARIADVAERLASAERERAPVRIVGQGSWLDAGRPVDAAHDVSAALLTGIIEYVPGDLVMTVAAGTTLREIADATGEHGQWLALDPYGSDRGSIGATIATASSGPLALGAGRARDLVLGASVLTASGTAVRAGGRVVKNVAGFDLVRLWTGAYGTLGVVTDVSLRLHALPAVDETFAVSVARADIGMLSERLGLDALGFMALELLNPAAARWCGAAAGNGTDAWTLLARVAGNRQRSTAQREKLAALGAVREIGNDVWQRVRAIDGERSAVARVSCAPSLLSDTLTDVERHIGNAHGVLLCVTPHRGGIRAVFPTAESTPEAPMAGIVRALQGGNRAFTVLWERLPTECWPLVAPAAVDLISQRIRDAFDPQRVLNRGIFGDALAPRSLTAVA